jgi:hypothetical protein
VANSQLSDRWEARMYIRLIERYQQADPDRHVIMLHARGFAEQILDPSGRPTDTAHSGIPRLTSPISACRRTRRRVRATPITSPCCT